MRRCIVSAAHVQLFCKEEVLPICNVIRKRLSDTSGVALSNLLILQEEGRLRIGLGCCAPAMPCSIAADLCSVNLCGCCLC